MSFNGKYDEIRLLLHLSEARQQQDYKIIREALEEMKHQYEHHVSQIEDDGDGNRGKP
jgi:hypothetical protein